MAIITQAAAIVVANTIRDEVIVNANTCLRVGGLLRDMVDSMWPGDHADSHLPGGTDALATGVPVSIGAINAEGDSAELARRNHVHAHDEQGGGNLHTVATTVIAGFMSAAQVVALVDATSHVAITNGNPHGTSIANIGSGTLEQLNAAISGSNVYSTVQVDNLLTGYVPTSRTLTAGNGLVGGGSLAADRSFAVGALDGTIISAAGGVRVGTLLSTNFADHTIAPARITNGTNGQVLTMVSGDPAWASRSSSDYAQFLLLDGSRSMSGSLNMGGQQITNVGNVDGVDVSAHAARHLPGGADALAVDTPVSLGDSLGIGSRASFSRSDHVHTHGNRPGGTLHALATTSVAGFMSAAQVTAVTNATSHIANTSNPHQTSFSNLYGGTSGVVTNATVATNAAIAVTKLATGTANSVLWSNGSSNSWNTTPIVVGLTVAKPTDATLQITSGTTGIAALSLGDTDSATRGGFSYANSTDALLIRAGGAPIVRITNADVSPYSAGTATLGAAFRWGAAHFASATVTGGVDFNDSAAVDVSTINATAHVPRTTEVTLNASGVATVTGTAHTVDTYADAASDTMTTITDPGWPVGTILALRCANNAHDVIVSTGGNINLPYGLSTFLMGYSSTPILFVKCYSGAWTMLPPPEQGSLSVGSLSVSAGLNLNNSAIVGVSYTDYVSQANIPAVPAAGVRVGANGGNLFERSSEGGLWQLSPTAPPDICRVQRVIRLQDVASATTTLTLPELIPFVPESPSSNGPYYGFFWVNVRMMCRYRGGASYTEHASLSSFIFRIYRPYGSSTYTISAYGMGADNVYHQHGGTSFDYPRISSFSGSGTTPTAYVVIVPGSSALYPGTYVGQLDIFGPINTGSSGDWASA